MHPLTQYIRDKRKTQDILLMTHVVYGYPSIEDSLSIMRSLLNQGADILEVQFPFSDPVADGPTITTACHHALENKPRLEQLLADIEMLSKEFPKQHILLMSYLNPLLQFGLDNLANTMKNSGISSLIIPDILQDSYPLLAPLTEQNISPIWLVTPDMSDERIKQLKQRADGMLYCVSRKGVTGKQQPDSVDKSATIQIGNYLNRVKGLTELPLAMGFGIRTREDVKALIGHADVAIAGSVFLDAYNAGGIKAVGEQVTSLKSA